LGDSSNSIKPTDDLDQLDAENNKFQKETLNLFRSIKSSTYKAQVRDREGCSSSNVLMDVTTLNPTNAVKDDVDNCNPFAETNSVTSEMIQNLLLVDESEKVYPESNDDDEPMSASTAPDQFHWDPSEKSSPQNLPSSEHIIASTGYIEYEMELLLYEEKEISVQSTLLKHKMREVEAEGKECEKFLELWFDLVSRKNMAFHRRLVLDILQREQDLEKRCEMLKDELRRGGRDEVGEQLLLEELLKIVDLRDQLVIARDREEKTMKEEVMVGKEIKSKLTKQEKKKHNCKSQ